MNINPVQHSSGVEPIKKVKADNIGKETKKKDPQSQEAIKYTPSEEQAPATYQKPNASIDSATIQKLKKQSEEAYGNLRSLVEKLLLKQGYTLKTITNEEWGNVEIDEITKIEAQNMIAPGGAYSPESVSDRIVEFAKALSGGDISKLETLREAIDKGFKEAETILGELPEISKQTYALVTEKLDEWAKEMEGTQKIE